MFSCSKCWENPCQCGEQYKHMSVKQLEALRRKLNEVIRDRLYKDHKDDESWEGPGNR